MGHRNKTTQKTSREDSLGVFEPAIEDPTGTIRAFDSSGGVANAPNCDVGNSLRAISEEIRTDRYLTDAPSKVASRHFDGSTRFTAMATSNSANGAARPPTNGAFNPITPTARGAD